MQRKVFDKLASGVGAVLVVILLAAGGLMIFGQAYTNKNIHDQMVTQQIYFPAKSEINAVKAQYAKGGQSAVTDQEFPNARVQIPAMEPYAGQQVLTGAEAKVYADQFIGQHLYAMPYHGVYSQVSAAAMKATPGSAQATQLDSLKNTVFMGTSLRGMLLEAYAFGTIGSIMLFGAIASFIGAAILAVLTALGIRHANKTSAEERLFDELKKTDSSVSEEPVA
jgi:hypothetical protein